jgi:antitoxin ParD1/3/4
MSAMSVSLPNQLKNWITQQVSSGRYSSASDYLRDLLREDMRHQQQAEQWLSNHLQPLADTPDKKFVSMDAAAIKQKARNKLKE